MSGRPRLLDLFSGAGGCAMGYHRAGFEVVGVDHRPQPRYPFEFHQADALEFLEAHGADFDAIHASPPCQGYSCLRHLPWLKDREYPRLIEPCRALLQAAGRPWVMENVENAPMVGVVLCGTMFGLPVFRHRRFASSHLLLVPAHMKHSRVIGSGRMLNDRSAGRSRGKELAPAWVPCDCCENFWCNIHDRHTHDCPCPPVEAWKTDPYSRRTCRLNAGSSAGTWGTTTIVTVAGGQFRKADGERALGIDWMTCPELSQAIPPAFTEYLGKQLLRAIEG